VIPFLRAFDPDLLIVSAGYDCLADDPLAQVCAKRVVAMGVIIV
jgi:acetoin utilization deacetylase AcuC-like enzyme